MDYLHVVLHPATVHLPIGVFFAACVLTGIAWRRKSVDLEGTGYTLVVFSWYSLIPATVTGIYDAVQRLRDVQTPAEALFWINLHAVSALLLWFMNWQAWQLRRRMQTVPIWEAQSYKKYGVRLIVGLICIVVSGWSGGYMVYSLRLGVSPGVLP